LEDEAKPQTLLWTAPDCPYRVTILAPVLNEIRIHAVESFYSVPRGGVEIGGVFFGVREAESLHIRAHRPIPCQYSTGPSFTLSVQDELGLSGVLDKAADDPDLAGMFPVGWYHSHTRSEIFLSPADLKLYNEFFPDRWQIAMVLRPANLKPTRAGFFFRDRWGAVKSDACVEELTLEPPTFGLAVIEGVAVPARQAAAPVTVVPAVALPPLPKVAPTPAPPVVIEPAPLVAAVAASSGVVIAVPPPEPVAVPPAEEVAVSEPSAPVEIGLPSFLAEPKFVDSRRNRRIWAQVAVIFLLFAAVGGAVLKWGRPSKPSDLGLETYDINGSFLIRWDRDSSVIRNAKRASLEIQDGGEKTPIELTSTELAAGGYGYMRRTGQVSVHMKVDGGAPAEEYSNFNAAQSLGSQQAPTGEAEPALAQALAEKEHLKTELINESMQSRDLRQEVASLRRQLAEERAKKGTAK
jgi:proteasome lid subunit RPN8/RPN11